MVLERGARLLREGKMSEKGKETRKERKRIEYQRKETNTPLIAIGGHFINLFYSESQCYLHFEKNEQIPASSRFTTKFVS